MAPPHRMGHDSQRHAGLWGGDGVFAHKPNSDTLGGSDRRIYQRIAATRVSGRRVGATSLALVACRAAFRA